ncbi:hypothetical protein LTR37_000021 [Vermiconidia calcicola]|uniref:Uncharacterized protein n=1 Tax=Vermiconidia calcicola TaxID=1690605 RepID=A0ACC3NZ48_9PEZI|nr:hypothetical protein LTR37_000021 [Vermiconidia calcicola]
MLSSITALLFAASSATLVSAQGSYGGASNLSAAYPPFSGNPFQKYNLEADGIKASFIPYGARLTNLYVKDRNGDWQDVAVGYDDGERYLEDSLTNHTYFGCVVGRYANRIRNGTFTVDGQESQIPKNEHEGVNPLHGGFVGYDQANWTIASLSGNSITFSFYDAHRQGFPGDVLNLATYTLTDDAAWVSRLVSIPFNEATPIMLSNHVYWNLGAFVDEQATTVLNNTLYMPYADRYIETDGILIPTGQIGVTNSTYLDFTKPKTIGRDIQDSTGGCGTGCTGYDNGFILDKPRYVSPEDPNVEVLRMSSPSTGIQMSLETNMQGIQIYSCVGQNGSIRLKEDQQHGDETAFLEQSGCVVVEAQDWIDGINNPQWGRQQWQIFSPTTLPAVNYQKYTFSVV